MPELPEVETCLRGIRPYLVGKVIEQIIIRNIRLRWELNDQLWHMQGAKISAVTRRAKYLIIHSDKGDIILHLGMSGSLRITKTNLALLKHDHIDLVIKDGTILRYNDPRRFGCWLWAESALQLPLLAKLGPEPLPELSEESISKHDITFSPYYLFEKTRTKTKSIKNLIMDNQIVVGVGNIYACESLFFAQIHPETMSKKLSLAQCEILVSKIQQVLRSAIDQGGTTLKDFRQPDGKPGYFTQVLQVYGRKGEPCNCCGERIEAKVIGQRNSFFCSNCQKI